MERIENRPKDRSFSWNIGSEVKSVGNGANTPYVFAHSQFRGLTSTNRLGKEEYLTDRLNLKP